MRRGEIRWYTFAPPDKKRPVMLLTRDEVVDALNELIVVPITRTIRGIPSELRLTPADGMQTECVLNFDHIALAQRARLGSVITTLRAERWVEVREALLVATGIQSGTAPTP